MIDVEKDRLGLDTGIEEQNREKNAQVLFQLLSSTYFLYLKTQNYHWNVTGTLFYSLHRLFQTQYEELSEAIDEIAERIRALGHFPQGSFAAFSKATVVKDETTTLRSAQAMVQQLLSDHESIIILLRRHLQEIEQTIDGATADLINKRLATHEKQSWMLRSTVTP